jgi:hypothetical protein
MLQNVDIFDVQLDAATMAFSEDAECIDWLVFNAFVPFCAFWLRGGLVAYS